MAGNYLVTLPLFLLYFGSSLALTVVFLGIYQWITPHHEMRLIREGNAAAAVSLAGAGLGFILPLSSAIANSQNLSDMLVWGVVAMIVQLLTFAVARLLKPELCTRISEGSMAAGTFLAAMSLGVGVLNAACLTY